VNKNVSGQQLTVQMWDATTGLPKTGDAANLTAYVSKDDGSVTALTDTSATEASSSNAKGQYLFNLTQGETNADKLTFSVVSATSNIVGVATPAVVYTRPANASALSIDSSGRVDVGKALGTAVTLDANNVLNVSTKYVGGTLQTARDLGTSVLLSSGTGTGQISLSSGAVLLQATQTGVTIPTVTTLTNLPSIPANWITAAGITDGAFTAAKFAASSLNGKGDWSTTAPLDAAGTRSALGLATNNLDTQLTAIGNSAASAASSAGSAASSSSSAAASAGTAVTQTTAGAIRTAAGLASANLDTQLGDIKTDTGNLVTRITSTLFSGITSLAQWLGMLAGKQTPNTTARTEIRATGAGSGTFDPTTDSEEAIRDRGDAAWTTGSGGGGGGGTTVVAGAMGAQTNTQTFTVVGGTITNLSIAQNEGKTLVFKAQVSNDGMTEAYDLTGKQVQFLVFEKADDGAIVLTKDTADNNITLSASDSEAPSVFDQINVDIDPADTATKGTWNWELRVITDDNAYLAGGEWKVQRAPLA
jgi:hypothetical protein